MRSRSSSARGCFIPIVYVHDRNNRYMSVIVKLKISYSAIGLNVMA